MNKTAVSVDTIKREIDSLVREGALSTDKALEIKRLLPRVDKVVALYDFTPQQDDDLQLSQGDIIAVLEKPSDNWWKGTNTTTGTTGVFPANYVKPYVDSEDRDFDKEKLKERDRVLPQVPNNNKASSPTVEPPQGPPPYQQSYQQQPPQQYYQQQPPQQYYQQPPPQQYPPSAPYQQPVVQPVGQPYVQPYVQQPVQVQGQEQQSTMSKIGHQLGSAAIFGAGATIGSDLVNSIFWYTRKLYLYRTYIDLLIY